MNKLTKYIRRYFRGTKSLFVGMKTSMKIFCEPSITEQYPENRHTTLHIPERHRAMLTMYHNELNQHKCVACGLCQMSCPNGSIKVKSETVEEDGKKKKRLVSYEYDLGSCMFCQLCVEACPHGAIGFTNEFENAVFERERLFLTLNKEGSVCAPKSTAPKSTTPKDTAETKTVKVEAVKAEAAKTETSASETAKTENGN